MKNKTLSAVLERLDKRFNIGVCPCKFGFEEFIKAEFNSYFTARLEEVLAKEEELDCGDTAWQDGFKTGNNSAIKQTKRNAKD